ncbi:MAG: tetratricopeptide repeat protein [Myxococcota bacterium]
MRFVLATCVLGLAYWAAPLQAQEPFPSGDEQAPPDPFAPAEDGDVVPADEDGDASSPNASSPDASSPVTADPADRDAAREPVPELPSFLDTTDSRIVDERPAPTADQVAALREMEAEVERFARVGGAYRESVASLLRREYLRQRRGRDRWYGRQITDEERSLNEARDAAIVVFERFLRRYPDDPTYSPDAMFRLGELYFERSSIQFDEAEARAMDDPDAEVADVADFTPTIELYRRLVRDFGTNYRRIDGVYYLIGFCLNAMGRFEEARDAWLALVCANEYEYDPDHHATVGTEEEDPALDPTEDPELYPSLSGADPEAEEPATPAVVDPYAECTVIRDDARFVSETWFRIGEFHFDDYTDDDALEKAISAYSRILEDPEDRNYSLALYKVAWAYYRASRYPEAIRAFSQLVQWSDDREEATGQAGSQLRPEALQYLGITFAYDDWNENGLPDTVEGLPSGIDRVQNTSLLPQDRAWSPDVYFELGSVYFEEAKYEDAVAVWNLFLEKYPNHVRAPEVTNQIAEAYRRNNQFELEREYSARLAGYGAESDWAQENLDDAAALRRAEELAEQAVIRTAIETHTQAQRDRRRCIELQQEGDIQAALARCQEANGQYAIAAENYRRYLERYPNDPQAYDLRYNLADALYWSENYEEAAAEYATVRDSNLDDRFLSESARRVVESMTRIVEAAQERGELAVRQDPPAVEGDPPRVRPVEMPMLLQNLAQARELYIARVPEEQDTERVRPAYEYNNALLLYWYGYWPQAEERFESIFDERCSGPTANETGEIAWESLRTMAIAYDDIDEIERLANDLSSRGCTFSPDGEACPTGEALENFCAEPGNSQNRCCRALGDVQAIEYRRALEVFETAEQATPGPQQEELYLRAATMLVEAVNRTPGNEEAPVALEYAARALEETQRFDSARRLYQRIIDEVGPQQADDPERQERLDSIVANAYFRVAFTAQQSFEYDAAVANYRTLVDSSRFARSQQTRIQNYRRDALINTADLFLKLQRYREATQYYEEIIASPAADATLKREAQYAIAEIAYKQQSWSNTIRRMRSFIDRYRNDAEAGELVVQAHWRIAEARKALRQTRDYTGALQDVVSAFGRSGQPAGSFAAEFAAHAQFLITDESIDEFERFAIEPGRPSSLEQYVQTVAQQISAGEAEAARFAEGYASVLQFGRPTWSVAAFVEQGRVFETLARAVLNTPFAMPSDLQRQMRSLDEFAREDIRIQVEDRIRMVLDERVRPIECLAVARYALAARAARAGSLDDEYTRIAIDRLQAYGDERIAECIAEEQARDASFQAYSPGEFTRAPRGQNMSMAPDVGAPALATE